MTPVQVDILKLALDERFDVALCGFTVQMFDDLMAVPRALARHLRRGGLAGLSAWAAGSWEPHRTAFSRAVAKVRPDLVPKPGNIEKLQGPGVIKGLMRQAGFAAVEVETVEHPHVLGSFDDYWRLVTTLAGRPVFEKLSPAELAALRDVVEVEIAPVCDSDGRLTLSMATMFVHGTV